MTYMRVTPEVFRLADGKSDVPVNMNVGLVPPDYEVETAEVDLYKDGRKVSTLPVTFNSPGLATLPAGFAFNLSSTYTAQTVINRGIVDRELKSAVKPIRPAEVEIDWAKEIEVTESGKQQPLDILKLYDARPKVEMDPVVATGGLRATVTGKVRDDLAPVQKLYVNGRDVKLTHKAPPAPSTTSEIGPFEATFTMPFQEVVQNFNPFTFWKTIFDPASANAVEYGFEGTVAAATAVNVLKNVGWDSAILTPNANHDGTISGGDGTTTGLGVVAQETVPEMASRSDYQFRIVVKDRGLGDRCLPVKVKTDVEEKIVGTVWIIDACFTRPLYLVPETFTVPSGLDAKTTEDIKNTRIRGKLGTRVSVTYVNEDIKDEGIVAGAELVDAEGNALKFVPAALGAPVVRLTSVVAAAKPGNPLLGRWDTRWEASAQGTVRDPIAAVFPDLAPKVTVNGVNATVTPAGGGGLFNFSASGALLLPETRVYARAESANGAVAHDYRDVTLQYPDNGLIATGATVSAAPSPVQLAPESLKPFHVRVYGPLMPLSDISGDVRGAYSIPTGDGPWHWSGQLPPAISLSFKDTGPGTGKGVRVYRSEQAVLPVKVPSHRFRQPTTPARVSQKPILPVEVGGFADARVTLGSGGEVRGLTDVSGFELVTPREGGIVNVSKSLLARTSDLFPESFSPVLGVTLKWRGIGGLTSILSGSPDSGGRVTDLSPRLGKASPDSTVVSIDMLGELGENILLGSATDKDGRPYRAQANTFAFTADMVANESIVAPFNADDMTGMQLAPGVYYNSNLSDGFDVLVPFGRSDVEISEHLGKNGLRVTAMKRNLGSLLTVYRADGKSGLTEPLAVALPDNLPMSTYAGTVPPLPEQLMDGQEVTWQDIVDAGYQTAWQGSYQNEAPDLRWADVRERSAIMQRVRERHGLPRRPDGMSVEYQAYLDGWVKEIGIQLGLMALFELPAILRTSLAIADDFFLGLVRLSASEGRVLEVLNTAGVFRAPIILPALEDTAQVSVSAGTLTSPRITSLATTWNNSSRILKSGAFSANARKAAYVAQNTASRELGEIGLREYIVSRYGSGTTICCPGLPGSGGGATSLFDEVVELPLLDGAGNVVGTKLFLGEAKGGVTHFDILSKLQGRLVNLPGRGELYAARGTREYIHGTALKMARPSNPPDVQAAGLKVLDKINRGAWNEIEYTFVSAKWVKQGNGVTGISPMLRIDKADLLR